MKALALILLALSCPTLAQDSFSSPDKAYHLVGSAFVGLAVAEKWPTKPWLTQFGIAMIPGIAKELTDARISPKDLVANAVGAAIGVSTARFMISRRNGVTNVAMVFPL